jgi:leucyl/phenylalanyl-tRNA--protein transferase
VAIEPAPTPWQFPPVDEADEDGIVGIGADLAPGTLLHAYRRGIFPMHVSGQVLAWWSPDPRGVLPLDGLRVSRSLRRARRPDAGGGDPPGDPGVEGGADPRRPDGWINHEIRAAYAELHRLGWAHSVEAWDDEGLAGGLYGVAIGGLFSGESMFHRRTDASKVALVGLVGLLREAGPADRLLDVQWVTPHLATLGAVAVPRREYLARLERALRLPVPPAFTGER